MKKHNSVHPDMLLARQYVYEPAGLICKNFMPEVESQEYGACECEINNKRIKFRVGKITPTKVGQFVTLWKRINNGPIMPYDRDDAVDLFVVSVRKNEQWGQFVFPKSVLLEQGIISVAGKGGKRAMRVYPSWDKTTNDQAQKTQEWQLNYFFEINECLDKAKIKKLFS